MMIKAAWGLGEAIVGGHVTPNTVVVDKASGRVVEHKIGTKDVTTVRIRGGTREEPVPMHPGDVLVAVATTPAWTPLFAMASAVVTDIGGPLSHSSMVAREYGIPAVMATGVATRRIHTGQMITVDGSAGLVSTQVSRT